MRKKHKWLTAMALAVIATSLILLLAFAALSIYISRNISFAVDEALFNGAKSDTVTKFFYDRSGNSFSDLQSYDPVIYREISFGSERKEWYSYAEISEYIKDGFLAMEDRHFFEHSGVDVVRTAMAFVNYFTKSVKSFGGSTITQQVIKNISGDNERTLKRKLNEIIRAYHIEYSHSKEEIFELYLNIVPMSENIVGVGYASECYFSKSPSDLTVAEAAMLVGIANAPTKYNPYNNPIDCKKKRNVVLKAMLDTEKITEEEYERSVSEELLLSPRRNSENDINSWFIETVCDEICDDLSKEYALTRQAARKLVFNGGLTVYTTVDPSIQSLIEEYFKEESNFPDSEGLQFSMVINDSVSGDLRAIMGARGNKNANRILNMATVPRSPGSALKPIALYAPLVDCGRICWSTVFDDAPVSFYKGENGEYVEFPRNYPQVYDGLTTVYDALRLSKNTVAVRLYNLLGADRIFSILKDDYGFDSLIARETKADGSIISDLAPSPLALGQLSYGVSLKKLTNAYTVFSADGKLHSNRSYLAVFDSQCNLISEKKNEGKVIISPESARLMLQILSGVTDSGTASKIRLKEIVDLAGKTGTSGNDKDRWFVGITPYYTAGIWCGYKDRSASVGNHERNHLKIWDEIMGEIHEMKLGYSDNIREFSTDGLLYAPYCKDSGKAFSPECLYDERGSRLEYGYFIKGSEPVDKCDWHIYTGGGAEIGKRKKTA